MTVGELIQQLQALEAPHRIVVMAKDAEGNGYSPLSSMWIGAYAPDSTWSGTAGFEFLTPEDEAAGYDEEDLIVGQSAVILCPTN